MSAQDPMLPQVSHLQQRQQENHNTFSFVCPSPLPAFAPGQFSMLYVFGVGEVPISISGSPLQPELQTFTVREVGQVTRALARLPEGTALGLRGPYGSAWPLDQARGQDLLIVAGGLGLAPVRPVIYSVLAERERYGRVWLLHGNRHPRELFYKAELEQWAAESQLDLRLIVDSADRSWRGQVGVITDLLRELADDRDFAPERSLAMICGPELMMHFSALRLLEMGLTPARIFVSLERNMQCALGFCGHCQYGPHFICKDGPVFAWPDVAGLLALKEV
ncbi:MAG: FAD/NAD(P)-binding protein [Candidatus Sericytochromatia bacterium]|nr:FAD/NAD(P)-binding protein [Candidatus Sericytochromatia bacterium]